MNSFLSWVGGKKLLRDTIVRLFPLFRDKYIEVFGGGGWVLFHKLVEQGREVYNDYNGLLVNLFRCVQNKSKAARMDDRQGGGAVGLAVLRMLHSMGQIFREETAKDGIFGGMHIDSKRRRQILDKRLAMGHKIDDHEDPENNINNQAMR